MLAVNHAKALRDECLKREIFYSLREAQVVIGAWKDHYNRIRPHSALGYRPPAPVTRAFANHLPTRSEEHTSELQSRQYLVCRLLLEKKKKLQTTLYNLGKLT